LSPPMMAQNEMWETRLNINITDISLFMDGCF
jgi:hypothetical protein